MNQEKKTSYKVSGWFLLVIAVILYQTKDTTLISLGQGLNIAALYFFGALTYDDFKIWRAKK